MSEKEKKQKDTACDCASEDCNCDETITLELEDGTSQEFLILGTIEHKKKNYVALAPMEGEEYFVYGYKEQGENLEFFSIEDDDEFDNVAKLFEKSFAEEMEESE
ncbi:MAG: DUF1292 domain-containing protein [Candidatus Cloacimonetes bacterium]|nr:DUF1292 domain-containing protein [Candidatus Cloacimonadota bacterium]